MSLSVKLGGVEVAGTIRLRASGEAGISGLTSAADGTGSQGGLVIDDPNGTVNIQAWMPVTVEESECTTAPRLFTGYVADYTYFRGKYLSGVSRQIDVTVNDQNVLLWLRLLTGGDTQRPSETNTARLAWLLASAYLSGIVYDLGLVTASGRTFDAENTHGLLPGDVIKELLEGNQIYFAYWDQVAAKVGLFVDHPDAVIHTSEVTISNVLSDNNGTTCFPPFEDAQMVVTGEDIYGNIRYVYANGKVYETKVSTETTFFPSPLLHRGINVENLKVGKLATAQTLAHNILDADSIERTTVTCTIQLPRFEVGKIDAGHRVGVRFTHFRGLSTLTYLRVEKKVLVPTEGNPETYDVQLTLSTKGLNGSNTGGGGSPGPVTNACDVTPTQVVTGGSGVASFTTLAITAPNPGDLLIVNIVGRIAGGTPSCSDNGSISPSGWTQHPASPMTNSRPDQLVGYSKTAAGDETLITIHSGGLGGTCEAFIVVVPGATLSNTTSSTGSSGGGGVMSWTSGTFAATHGLLVTAVMPSADDASHDYNGIGQSGSTEVLDGTTAGNTLAPGFWFGYIFSAASLSGTWNHYPQDYVALAWGIDCTATPEPPTAGQWTQWLFIANGNGTTTTFTFPFPYRPGTLQVRVDGVVIVLGLTEVDPAAGTFSLDFAPLGASGDTRAEIVEARAQGPA